MSLKLWIKLVFAILFLSLSGQAFALCAAQDMAGSWNNVDRNTRGITRVQIHFSCNDVIVNGQPTPRLDTVRVWGSCQPNDCDWGQETLKGQFWDGREKQTTYAETTFDSGFAVKRLKLYLLNPNRLMVIGLTDFKDSGRPDYSSVAYFNK